MRIKEDLNKTRAVHTYAGHQRWLQLPERSAFILGVGWAHQQHSEEEAGGRGSKGDPESVQERSGYSGEGETCGGGVRLLPPGGCNGVRRPSETFSRSWMSTTWWSAETHLSFCLPQVTGQVWLINLHTGNTNLLVIIQITNPVSRLPDG